MSSANNKSSASSSDKMKLVPMRSFNDFLLDSKKYMPPAFNDLKRFNNRVTSNLLYYQTNYFVISAVVFSIFLLFQSGRLLGGAFGIFITLANILFTLDRIPQVSSLRAQYPLGVYGGWFLNFIVAYSALRPILFFLQIVLVPVLFWILHASMRSRGLKNKISNKMEQLGAQVYASTPMGFVLQSLGFEARDYEE